MKKFKKIILAFTLVLSTLAFVPLSEGQQAYAASDTDCNNDSKCVQYIKRDLVVNQYLDLYGFTNVEIKSGASYVKLVDGVRVKGVKPGGEVVVYAYDRQGDYIMYSITVRKTIFG